MQYAADTRNAFCAIGVSMTPFYILYFGLLIALVLVVCVELWHIRQRPPPKDDEREPWIQMWPPDDKC